MGLEFWANISTVWLGLLFFVGGLIPLVAAFYAIRGMHMALGKSRSVMQTAQTYSGLMRKKADAISEKVAEPLIEAEAKAAQIETTIRNLAE